MNTPEDSAKKACLDRRHQVLDAASDCFCTLGFHGASIATISKCAGMSAGHIYHYFENKEAIIAAIVERDLNEVLSVFEQIGNAEDVLEAFLSRTAQGIDAKLDRRRSALKVEVFAEAGRNPKVEEMLQRVDRLVSAKILSVIQSARRDLPALSDAELRARVEVLGALFHGLMLRSLCNRDIDRAELLHALEPTIRALLVG